MDDAQAFDAAHNQRRDESFVTWMKKEETKMFLSLLPPSNNETQRETLTVLLRSAFGEGFNTGAASVALTFLEKMMRAER